MRLYEFSENINSNNIRERLIIRADSISDSNHPHVNKIEELANIGWWSLTNTNLYEFNFSKEIYRILKIKEGKNGILYNDFISLIFLTDKDLVLKAISALVELNSIMDLDFRVVLPDGEIRTIRMHGETSSTFNQSKNFIFGTIQDRTEYESIKTKYDEIKIKYDQLFNNGLYGIYTSTVGGKIISANHKFYEILGIPFNSKNVSVNLYKDGFVNYERSDKLQYLFLEKNEVLGIESEWRNNEGNVITVRENLRALKSESGKIIQFDSTIEDISEQIQNNIKLTIAKENAEKSENLKSMFLSQISHEIRTPINSLLNYAELIKYSFQATENKDVSMAISGISRAGNRLIRTMDLIINMSEMLNDSYVLNKKTIDLFTDVLEKCYTEYFAIAKAKGIELSIKSCKIRTIIISDEYSLLQIFNNIIDNAVKYTANGYIKISINLDELKRINVNVSDTGIGISEEFLPHIFKPFSQEESGYTRSYEGNGLGLALVKKYCELHNADISIESKKGQGTNFRIIFPNNLSCY